MTVTRLQRVKMKHMFEINMKRNKSLCQQQLTKISSDEVFLRGFQDFRKMFPLYYVLMSLTVSTTHWRVIRRYSFPFIYFQIRLGLWRIQYASRIHRQRLQSRCPSPCADGRPEAQSAQQRQLITDERPCSLHRLYTNGLARGAQWATMPHPSCDAVGAERSTIAWSGRK